MLRRIAAAARAFIDHVLHQTSHRRRRRRTDALRAATIAICDLLEDRRLLSVTFDTIDAQYIAEGSAASVGVVAHLDSGDDPIEIYADPGDGSQLLDLGAVNYAGGITYLSFAHTYADDGDYTVNLFAGSPSAPDGQTSFLVDVADIAPDLRLGGNDFAQRNVNYNLSLYHYDPGAKSSSDN
jgi:hypothetical protein